MSELNLVLETLSGETRSRFTPTRAVIAGWTGRDLEALEKHIVELEELGVARPDTIPTFYPVSTSRLTTATSIEVLGGKSSGEIEPLLLNIDGELWIGIASDHTDREVETYHVGVSKQMCDKPMSDKIWPLRDLLDHWDELELRAWRYQDGERVLYQEGKVTAVLSPRDLRARYEEYGHDFIEGIAMTGGTLAAIGGIVPSERFEMELFDPILNRVIRHAYDIEVIQV